MQISEESTIALKPIADVTRSAKQGSSQKVLCSPKLFFFYKKYAKVEFLSKTISKTWLKFRVFHENIPEDKVVNVYPI